ncbi:mCG16761, isoform CRA_a, partial [Mus musculus]
MWWGGRGQSFNIAPQKEEPEMGLSGPKSNPGNRMPEPSSHQLGSCLASGCLPGEHILAWAPGRRKGPGLDLPGTLICTNFRVTFQPCGWQRKQDTPLSSENDFALINIGRLEAVSGLSRVQLLRPGSQLKFIPEELLLHGRDFRLLRVGFEAGGLAPQAFQVTMAIIQARAQSSQVQQYRGITLSKVGKVSGSRKPPIPLLETLEDWETECKKQGARGWRVSTVNERFDVATSLSGYFWVPNRILDSEVRRAFAHFHQGRGPVSLKL